MDRNALKIALALVVALGLPVAAYAAQGAYDTGIPDRTKKVMVQYHLHPAFGKLGRGVGNALGGWLEIPIQIEDHYAPADPLPTFATGLAVGVFKGLVRTGVGVYEAVTFLVPYPEEYEPVLPPLAYFQRKLRW